MASTRHHTIPTCSRYIDIAYDNYGYMPGDFVMWNDMSPKRKQANSRDIGVYIGSIRPGELEILMNDQPVIVHWNEIKPMGFKSRSKRK